MPESGAGNRSNARDLPPEIGAWLPAHGFPGDNIEAVIQNRTTPLMHACRLGERAIVEALIAAGADLAATNGDGNNALWLACYHGDREIIDRLVAAGIAIDHQNDNGATCLMYAASSGKSQVVAQLLAAGADCGLTNHDDFTALDMAADLECLRLLLASRRHDKGRGP